MAAVIGNRTELPARSAFVVGCSLPNARSSMEHFTTNYTSTIATHIARSAAIGRARGLSVEISAPFLRLLRRRSFALLTFHLTHIVLEYLEVEPRDRNKHYGSAMLDDVIAIGEALALRIDLIAESTTQTDGRGLIQSNLENWYRRHEFVRADDALMRRVPTVHSAG
jgi:hypothetical protein